jgi:hypothetical protein
MAMRSSHSPAGFADRRGQTTEHFARIDALLHEPAPTRQKLVSLARRGSEVLGDLSQDRAALLVGQRAIGLSHDHHHGGGRLARVFDQIEWVDIGFAAPRPAPEKTVHLVGRIGDVAHGIGRLLHAPQEEERNAKGCANRGKNVHVPVSRCAWYSRHE